MMKKGLLSVLLILLMIPAAVFAAGTQESAEMAALNDVDPSGQEILYWYQHNRSREEGLKLILDEFNATNDYGITVVGEYAGGYSDIYNKMMTAIAGGSMPNVVVGYQNQTAMYGLNDALVDLNPYVEHPKWGLGEDKDDFFEGFYMQDVNAMLDGMRTGFPPNRSLEVMYYNATWLKALGYSEPPASWDEFYEVCKKATESGDDKYGYAIRTDASNVFALTIARGGEIEKEEGGYIFNTPETKDSLTFMKKLLDDGYAIKIAESYGDQTDFGNSKVLFTMGSTSGLPYYASAVEGSDAPFDWSVAPIPHTTDKAVLDVYGASLSVCKSTPEKELASWELLKFLTTPAKQAQWVEISNYFPVRKSVADSLTDYIAKNPKYGEAFNLLLTSDTKAEPPYAGYDEVRDAMAAAFNAILDGADPDKTLADLEEEANEVYADVVAE